MNVPHGHVVSCNLSAGDRGFAEVGIVFFYVLFPKLYFNFSNGEHAYLGRPRQVECSVSDKLEGSEQAYYPTGGTGGSRSQQIFNFLSFSALLLCSETRATSLNPALINASAVVIILFIAPLDMPLVQRIEVAIQRALK
jgi:hypothetical protein